MTTELDAVIAQVRQRLGDRLQLPSSWLSDEDKASELQRVQRDRAQDAAYEAELIMALAAQRPATGDPEPGTPGARRPGWAVDEAYGGASEFFAAELSAVLNVGRGTAQYRYRRAYTWATKLPLTFAALSAGELDERRAAELADVLQHTSAGIAGQVEAALIGEATDLSVSRLKSRATEEMLRLDAAAAEERREAAAKAADVHLYPSATEGWATVAVDLPTDEAAECVDVVDQLATMLKADGDDRPIGALRAHVASMLLRRPADNGLPPVVANLTITAALAALEGASTAPGEVNGLPITAVHLRDLLARAAGEDDGVTDLRTTFSAEVAAAARRLAGVAERTPLQRNARLSELTGAEVWVKREDLQVGRSYKVRGAYNTISQLDDVGRAAGAVTASAGNHGQGVAYACRVLGVRGRVFVPGTTPRQKRQRIAALGGDMVDLVVHGDTYDDAAAAAAEHAVLTRATLVPAFDALSTVIGQATVAVELLAQLATAPDVVVLPVGGGGLLAGCATWLREHSPGTRVVGVEPAGAANMAAALAAGHPVELAEIDTFVDGASVRRAGEVTHPMVRDSGAELVTVPEGRVCTEMLDLYQVDGVIAEPAGALASAALAGGAVRVEPGQTVVSLLSGGNNDVSRYAEVVERSLVHRGLKHYFLVEFPQEPGALRRFLDEVLGPDDDIVLFEYVKRDNRETGAALTGIELGSPDGLAPLLARIESGPLKIEHLAPGTTAYRFLV